MNEDERERIEVELFTQALKRAYGYDYSDYAPASFRRRVAALAVSTGSGTIAGLTARLLHDPAVLPQVVAGLSVPVSEMFRNPTVFRALKEKVLPELASFPRISIWQAGCAYGEETYSLAILLEEAGLYERSRIYATDINEAALARAKEAIFAVRDAKAFSENYLKAGGEHSFSDYFVARYEHIKLDETLKRNISFNVHNLASDGVFCEAQLVLCRNVLIYFSNPLQDRALALFRDSLVRGGFLCLGNKEVLDFAPSAKAFRPVDLPARIYRLHAEDA